MCLKASSKNNESTCESATHRHCRTDRRRQNESRAPPRASIARRNCVGGFAPGVSRHGHRHRETDRRRTSSRAASFARPGCARRNVHAVRLSTSRVRDDCGNSPARTFAVTRRRHRLVRARGVGRIDNSARRAERGIARATRTTQQLDALAAERIDPRNKRRVIRAIEVCEETGAPISEQQTRRAPNYRVLRIGLTMPRAELYARINARVDAMLAAGLVEEVRGLLARGYTAETPAMSGLGYRQIELFLRGAVSYEEAVRLLKRDTRRFVHHQYSWFRLDDTRIRWFDLTTTPLEEIRNVVVAFIN
ncbi:MAG: hypothetical protein HZC40_10400 [Chloroflexi bacterium]|nr:hypothetical protein [Chloroflexota bacterium]